MTDQTTAIQRVSEILTSDMARARFNDILGERGAGAYIASVLLAVANNTNLQECTPMSIYSAAIQAATMRLSVDPSIGHAYIIPYKGKATFQPGYKGIYFMAMRTGQYRYINVGEIYEGEEVVEDRITGMHRIEGKAISKKRIGWIGAFELVNGFSHTVYWTVEEVHEHARKYSKNYADEKSKWRTETRKMERKTVLTNMLKQWGYLDPADRAALAAIEEEKQPEEDDRYSDDDTVEGEIVQPEPAMSREQAEAQAAQLMKQLGF